MRKSVRSFPWASRLTSSGPRLAFTPPVLKTRFFPYMAGRGSVWFSSYMATSATVPLGRASRQAAWKLSRPPAHSITPSAPRPSVAAATADSRLGSAGSRASATSPCSSAIRRRQGSGSTPMTWAAPSRAAHSAAHSPTGPRPSTTAVSPGWKAHSSAPQ